MELLCPECLGALEALDGRTARCTVHGGEYTVLFNRWFQPPPLTPTAPAEPVPAREFSEGGRGSGPPLLEGTVRGVTGQLEPAPGIMCIEHVEVAAVAACQVCGRPMCTTCMFQGADGGPLCLDCFPRSAAGGQTVAGAAERTLTSTVPEGVCCVQHPHLQATVQCQSCGGFMCATCDFLLPGGVHVCPTCAASPRSGLSSRRKKLLGWSYALGVWSTAVMSALLTGVFAGMADDPAGEEAVGMLLSLLLFVPSLIGTALGVSALERRLPNPPAAWVAVAWNALILGGFILLIVIGLFSG